MKRHPDWAGVWAYHVTHKDLLASIKKEGLKPEWHRSADTIVIFVEPDLEGVEPYIAKDTVVLRFKTPGFGATDYGETVIFGGNEYENEYPELPLVGERGTDGVIPPERLQILKGKKFEWLVEL